MSAYNFQNWLADAVESGKKTQTIRFPRKYPARAGDTLSLYTGQRTKQCRLLRRAKCTSIKPILIDPTKHAVSMNGQSMHYDDIVEMAQKDGFACVSDFFDFFQSTYGDGPHNMELIQWEAKKD